MARFLGRNTNSSSSTALAFDNSAFNGADSSDESEVDVLFSQSKDTTSLIQNKNNNNNSYSAFKTRSSPSPPPMNGSSSGPQLSSMPPSLHLPLSSVMRSRQSDSSRTNIRVTNIDDVIGPEEPNNFIYKKVKSDDTLQGLSLKYRTTVSEIKRCNNLMNDFDLYALKYVKVPTAKHSLLLESNRTKLSPENVGSTSEVHDGDSLSEGSSLGDLNSSINNPTQQKSVKLRNDSESSYRSASESLTNDPSKWLESRTVSINQAMLISADLIQSDLSNVCSNAFTRSSTLEQIHTRQANRYSGADWGLSWQSAVCIMALICIAIPVFYLIYVRHHDPDQSNVETSSLGFPH